ncbi:MAG: hypothetical protein ABSF09_11575 [Candidatus Bathyarchaeia archaeon]
MSTGFISVGLQNTRLTVSFPAIRRGWWMLIIASRKFMSNRKNEHFDWGCTPIQQLENRSRDIMVGSDRSKKRRLARTPYKTTC